MEKMAGVRNPERISVGETGKGHSTKTHPFTFTHSALTLPMMDMSTGFSQYSKAELWSYDCTRTFGGSMGARVHTTSGLDMT